jgi:probable HAF family extracellular repeat protein
MEGFDRRPKVAIAAFAINESGEVTGSSDTTEIAPGNLHAFLYSHGTMLDLGTLPGQPSSEARAINRSGPGGGFHVSRAEHKRPRFPVQ